MALVTKPLTSAAKAAEDARHLALPVVAMGVVIAILYFGRVLFITSIIAVVIAFILDPFVTLLVRVRFPRSLASFLVCSVALLFLYIIAMGMYSQFSGIYEDLPKYGQRIGDLMDGVQQKIDGIEDRTKQLLLTARQREEQLRLQQQAQQQAQQRANGKRPRLPLAPPFNPATEPTTPEANVRIPIGDYIYSGLSSFYQVLLMCSFVPFLVYFMLSWRDHMNRSFLQFFHGEDRLVAARSLAGIAGMVRAFVVGNFLLGLLLAVISSTMFRMMHLPYAVLVGPLSGFMSLIPYAGLPLAMIPPLFVALTVNSVPVYVLVVASVAMLHLIALNLLYPKIVGSRVHLNPLVVTFSLMFWGFLWDAAGLLLAIPLTAGLKAVCDNVKGLRPIGKFLGD